MADNQTENESSDLREKDKTITELQNDIQKLENEITEKLDAFQETYSDVSFLGIDVSGTQIRIDCLINSSQHTKYRAP